jgi:hypothetical protein
VGVDSARCGVGHGRPSVADPSHDRILWERRLARVLKTPARGQPRNEQRFCERTVLDIAQVDALV